LNKACQDVKGMVYLKDWHWSKAKQVLQRLIEDGKVMESTPTVQGIFKSYKFKKQFEQSTESLDIRGCR
jgi:hypothetical protein